MASTNKPKTKPQMEGEEDYRNWAELNKDVLMEIFRLVGTIRVFKSAGPVCHSWRKLSRDEPELWRRIDFTDHGFWPNESKLVDPTKLAIDRSKGGLEEFWIEDFGDDGLLKYLSERTSMLKSLRLISCKKVSDESVVQIAKSQPLLEELEITLGLCSAKLPELIGKDLPNLKRFAFDGFYNHPPFSEEEYLKNCELAFGIGKSMHELRHLQIVGNRLSNKGLKAILRGCPHLETLDIRKCNTLNMDESDLQAQCARLRSIRLMDDSLADYPFPADTRVFFRSFLSPANYILSRLLNRSDDI